MQKIIVPPTAIPFIRLQRTHYGDVSDKEVIDLYTEEMEKDFTEIAPFLPLPLKDHFKWIDIGCGIGGINVLLYRKYKERKPSITLFDGPNIILKKKKPKIKYGFYDKDRFYNSFDQTVRIMEENNVSGFECSLPPIPEMFFDLVVSFWSWGFHYPIDYFAKTLFKHANENTAFITDLRKGKGQLEQIKKVFKKVKIISSVKKKDRVVFSGK